MRWQRYGIGVVLVVLVGAAVSRWCLPRSPVVTTPTKDTGMSREAQGRGANRLIREKSPYLLQHAYNPVDWYPWGEEAFAKAKREDKPVLVSIGYSTCYWCHVMEQESFENSAIATVMNDSVVAIKVDREERPDLDAIYMTAVQAMTGQGGWPLNVFLTPEGKPFWGGTYFPPEERWGRAGFPQVVQSMAAAWRTRREEVLRSSDELTRTIQAGVRTQATQALNLETLEAAAGQLAQRYDGTHGGFGEAPKFPQSHALSFLLRVWSRNREPRPLEMVEGTLQAMANGGMHDQLGGGFHRYSTDARWLVPHFEKMLYDQALLARAYLEAYQATRKPLYAEVARDIFAYVLRDLHDAQGAFYSAEDAGEVGEEGAFYLWTSREIEVVLGVGDAAPFNRFYGVSPAGNFTLEAGAHGTSQDHNILHIAESAEVVGKLHGLPAEAVASRLAAARGRLLEARAKRPRPHRDDKILTDWNGLMIGSLAYGARALDESSYAHAASQAATFLLARLQQDGQLLHRYRDGEAAIPAYLDDYVFLSWGLLELYETTFEPRWLAESKRLAQEMIRLFWDDTTGGFFLTGPHHEALVAKTKELYDGAAPSGNSVAALVLVRLADLTQDEALRQRADALIAAFSGQVAQAPQAFPQFLIALDGWLGPSQEIVIAGDPDVSQTQAMIRLVRERFVPRAVVALHPAKGPAKQAIEQLIPFIAAQEPLKGQPTAYVCERGVCQLPVTTLEQLQAQLP